MTRIALAVALYLFGVALAISADATLLLSGSITGNARNYQNEEDVFVDVDGIGIGAAVARTDSIGPMIAAYTSVAVVAVTVEGYGDFDYSKKSETNLLVGISIPISFFEKRIVFMISPAVHINALLLSGASPLGHYETLTDNAVAEYDGVEFGIGPGLLGNFSIYLGSQQRACVSINGFVSYDFASIGSEHPTVPPDDSTDARGRLSLIGGIVHGYAIGFGIRLN